MNNQGSSDSSIRIVLGTKPAPEQSELAKRVGDVVRAEHRRESIAEKYVRVPSRGGCVQIPGTEKYVSTHKPSLVIAGTDDQLFKEFNEGPVTRLHTALTHVDHITSVRAQIRYHPGGQNEEGYKLTKLGRLIIQCCEGYQEHWAISYVNHVLHPVNTVMLRAMERYAVRICQQGRGNDTFTQSFDLVRLLDSLARFVRRACATWSFINILREYKRQAARNFDSARKLIFHLAERHSKLLIIRVDLYHQPYYDSEKSRREINKFLRRLRTCAGMRRLLPAYCGFIIKRESGIIRGTHWHLLIICDGNFQRSVGYISQEIGEAWAVQTKQGAGSYYNCYSDRNKYEFNGLGLLTLGDWEKMAGLRAALYYMTKQDCVLIATDDKVKNFWRSTIQSSNTKRGRPRHEPDSLKLFKRMLGGNRSKYPPGFERSRRPLNLK